MNNNYERIISAFIKGETPVDSSLLVINTAMNKYMEEILAKNQLADVLINSASEFADCYIEYLRKKEAREFRENYTSADLLIIDNLNKMEKWLYTQRELAAIINTRIRNKKKTIVLYNPKVWNSSLWINDIEEILHSGMTLSADFKVDLGNEVSCSETELEWTQGLINELEIDAYNVEKMLNERQETMSWIEEKFNHARESGNESMLYEIKKIIEKELKSLNPDIDDKGHTFNEYKEEFNRWKNEKIDEYRLVRKAIEGLVEKQENEQDV